ncbi:CoA pyrophosphatase [Rhodocyclus tenuis]|uniref:CoA pyrophosphatase n=1 Tax=Rhodocyclus gracilis TaxID=2929842 RepID=UPI001298A347|nr:CoA pyrophosphatase [Rhodocyclus gracilis]MRD72499.1 CoA pyrophosphatase [Rhodocyclus gracilis]
MAGDIDLAALRSRLLTAPRAQGDASVEDGVQASVDSTTLTPAAVLVPIVLRRQAPTLLLTRRNDRLKDHPGQISFPGGRIEASDASPEAAALREAQEEIGLDHRRVEVQGFLPDYCTGTGFRITPVVATLHPPFALRAEPDEVAEIFEVPLAFMLDPANHQRHPYTLPTRSGHYDAIPWQDRYIWGATAGMIRLLACRAGEVLPPFER